MIKTIFYAWQSQLPSQANRSLIEAALEKAVEQLARDATFPAQFSIEQDSRGALGSVEISSHILARIEACDVFVGDVTPVGTLLNGKPCPNPNVMFELGYAWRSLDDANVVLVLNRAYGKPEDLPFDISKRSLVQYSLNPASGGAPGPARDALTTQFLKILDQVARADGFKALRDAGLTAPDIHLFKGVMAQIVASGREVCSYEEIQRLGLVGGLEGTALGDAVQLIGDAGAWNAGPILGPARFSHIQITLSGMEMFLTAERPGYAALKGEVAKRVAEGAYSATELAAATKEPYIVIEHVLKLLARSGFVQISEIIGNTHVVQVLPKLRRVLSGAPGQT